MKENLRITSSFSAKSAFVLVIAGALFAVVEVIAVEVVAVEVIVVVVEVIVVVVVVVVAGTHLILQVCGAHLTLQFCIFPLLTMSF